MINQCAFEESYGCASWNIANGKRRDEIARFRFFPHSLSIKKYLVSERCMIIYIQRWSLTPLVSKIATV